MIENMTGEMLEPFKPPVVTGAHKNIFRKVPRKVLLILTNQNKINFPLKF
jgi:hypothetical protein